MRRGHSRNSQGEVGVDPLFQLRFLHWQHSTRLSGKEEDPVALLQAILLPAGRRSEILRYRDAGGCWRLVTWGTIGLLPRNEPTAMLDAGDATLAINPPRDLVEP
jgi:hypothetical protein